MTRFVFLMVLFIQACQPRPVTPPPSEKGQPLARIGSFVITDTEFKDQIKKIEASIPRNYATHAQKKELLEQLINMELLYQEALNNNLQNSTEFKARLADLVIEQFTRKALESVGQDEFKKVYEDHKNEFDAVSARHILFKFDKNTSSAEKQKKKAALLKIRDQALRSPDQFAELAKTHSEDASRSQGGELGFFVRDMMVKPFSDAAFRLTKINEISPIVETQFGYHIIQLSGSKRTFEDHQDLIKRTILKQKKKQWFEEEVARLRSKQKVEIYEEALHKLSPLPDVMKHDPK